MATILFHFLCHILVDYQRFLCAQDVCYEALFIRNKRINHHAFATFIRVWNMNQVIFTVVDRDSYIRLIENLTQAISNRIVNALNVELGYQCALYTIDDRQFSGALFGLIKEAGIFKRNTHAIGQSLQQALIRLMKSMLVLEIVKAERAEHNIANRKRHSYIGFPNRPSVLRWNRIVRQYFLFRTKI